MASGPSAKQLEIIRRLAAREAARRQAQTAPASSTVQQPAQTTFEEAAVLDAERLEPILCDERAKNDVAWARVCEQSDLLSDRPSEHVQNQAESGQEASIRAKQLELARLDFDIDRLTEDLPKLDPPHSDAILTLLTRATLASAIEQYEAGLQILRSEWQTQQGKLDEDEELVGDLEEVRIGLERRQEVLRARRETSDLASIKKKLLTRLEKVESALSQFLRRLIEVTDNLFKDGEGEQQAQLRHLIDRLINKAWDTPADPYVNVADDYLPSIPAFLLRANVAVEHPRDAHRLRLIEFHRAAVG